MTALSRSLLPGSGALRQLRDPAKLGQHSWPRGACRRAMAVLRADHPCTLQPEYADDGKSLLLRAKRTEFAERAVWNSPFLRPNADGLTSEGGMLSPTGTRIQEEVNNDYCANDDEKGDGRESGPADPGFPGQALGHLTSLLI
jgi:hypothetical protein